MAPPSSEPLFELNWQREILILPSTLLITPRVCNTKLFRNFESFISKSLVLKMTAPLSALLLSNWELSIDVSLLLYITPAHSATFDLKLQLFIFNSFTLYANPPLEVASFPIALEL